MEGSEKGGAMGGREDSETRGAWVGTGLGREDGGERDGSETGGAWVGTGRWRGATRGAWVGMGLGSEDGGERDGRRMGGDKMEGSETGGRQASQASLQAALGQCKSRTKHGWG